MKNISLNTLLNRLKKAMLNTLTKISLVFLVVIFVVEEGVVYAYDYNNPQYQEFLKYAA